MHTLMHDCAPAHQIALLEKNTEKRLASLAAAVKSLSACADGSAVAGQASVGLGMGGTEHFGMLWTCAQLADNTGYAGQLLYANEKSDCQVLSQTSGSWDPPGSCLTDEFAPKSVKLSRKEDAAGTTTFEISVTWQSGDVQVFTTQQQPPLGSWRQSSPLQYTSDPQHWKLVGPAGTAGPGPIFASVSRKIDNPADPRVLGGTGVDKLGPVLADPFAHPAAYDLPVMVDIRWASGAFHPPM